MISFAEYIWMDGAQPTQKLRSKTRVVCLQEGQQATLELFPEWSYDGSSTYQAAGGSSDLVLKPVYFRPDPLKAEQGHFIVMCEVFHADGTPHKTNSRARLREVLSAGADKLGAWFGFEQEYTLMKGHTPLGWPEMGFPAPQGPFYCGVGCDEAFGRQMVDEHAAKCVAAELLIFGTNAEVMPGQWEFQIGYRGFPGESADPLTVCDQLWLARWLLYRVGESYNIAATLHPKPVKGDWNGAGLHTNFSTDDMRSKETGRHTIEKVIRSLGETHQLHIPEYGDRLAERLTGTHETCSINEFRSGASDRGASIRIPLTVAREGYGYLEDRRPGANADPYRIAARILKTIIES